MPIPVSDEELADKLGHLAAMLSGNEQMRHSMQGHQFQDALAMMAREINLPVAALKEVLAKLPADELAAHAQLMLEQTQPSTHALDEADALEEADSDDELPALVRSRFRFRPFPPRPRPIYASSFLRPENGRLVPWLCWNRFEQRRRMTFRLATQVERPSSSSAGATGAAAAPLPRAGPLDLDGDDTASYGDDTDDDLPPLI